MPTRENKRRYTHWRIPGEERTLCGNVVTGTFDPRRPICSHCDRLAEKFGHQRPSFEDYFISESIESLDSFSSGGQSAS